MNVLTTTGMLNMALDALMIAAIGGLWLMWSRTARKQREVEALLLATSEQLDAALAHMEQAMAHIRRIEAAQPEEKTRKEPRRPATGQPRLIATEDEGRAPDLSGMGEVDEATPASAQAAPLTRVLRLHREGFGAEEIARRESIPLAKVRLMLKLHARQALA